MASALLQKRTWYAITVAVLIAGLAGAWMAGSWGLQHASAAWEQKLQSAAASHAGKMSSWLTEKRDALASLSENPSLQVYFLKSQKSADAPQRDYLTNLLTATSSKLGFQPAVNPMVRDQQLQAEGGIALMDNDGNLVAASQGMPAISAERMAQVRSADRGQVIFFGAVTSAEGVLQTGYLMPVYGMQADPSPEAQVGYIMAVIPMDGMLASLFSYSDVRLAINAQPGANDLFAQAPINGTSWYVLASVHKDVALADTIRWRNTMVLAVLFGVFAAVAVAYAAWLTHNRQHAVRLQSMNKIITLLSSVIDQRDPYAREHSAKVAALSSAVASRLKLDARMRETTELSAKLMNIGKAAVPHEMLTRTSRLAPQELFTIRSSLAQSVDILSDIHFDGPIVQTLEQAQERMDGSGPKELKGEQILISARIIAAVNTFVAMISPRAYREAFPVERALDLLGQEYNKFDSNVIGALRDCMHEQGSELLSQGQKQAV